MFKTQKKDKLLLFLFLFSLFTLLGTGTGNITKGYSLPVHSPGV